VKERELASVKTMAKLSELHVGAVGKRCEKMKKALDQGHKDTLTQANLNLPILLKWRSTLGWSQTEATHFGTGIEDDLLGPLIIVKYISVAIRKSKYWWKIIPI
jgi:hypothetical protein